MIVAYFLMCKKYLGINAIFLLTKVLHNDFAINTTIKPNKLYVLPAHAWSLLARNGLT